jgi:hypothetical protein
MIRDHVLLPSASRMEEADAALDKRITPDELRRIVSLIPDVWLVDAPFATAADHREAYMKYLARRLEPPRAFLEEALRARA